jgi:dihydroorotate dehydrogenase
MEKQYIYAGLAIVLFTLVVLVILHHREGFKEEERYKLIIPPNGILISKTQSEYGSDMPNYTVDQAIEIYKRGLDIVKDYKKSEYKSWEQSQLGVVFQDLITAIMFAPHRADELTKGLDTFNNNRVIATANVSSLETMHQPSLWVNNKDFMDVLKAYQDTDNLLLSQ